MNCDIAVREPLPTLDLSSPSLAADVARVLDDLELARTVNDPRRILTVTDDGSGNGGPGNPLYTTEAPHGLTQEAGAIKITGVSEPSYNLPVAVVNDVPSLTTFVTAATGFVGDGAGGRWEPA